MTRIHAHRMTTGARLARALPPVALGGILLALGISTGEIQGYGRSLRHLIEVMPLPEPGPNGYPLAVLLVAIVGCGWRLSRIRPAERRHLDRLLALDELDARDNEKWPVAEQLADPGSPWFGTAPFTVAPPVRRLHPVIPAEDLDPDPEQLNPTLLPVRPERRVRS